MPEPITETLDVANDLAEMPRVVDALDALWIRNGLPEEFQIPVAISVEEALSNVIRHGRPDGHACAIQVCFRVLDAEPGGIEVEVSDSAAAFDPLSLPTPDLTLPLEARKAGGLGVCMIRKMMDQVWYERRDGRNYLRFRKRWPAPAAGRQD